MPASWQRSDAVAIPWPTAVWVVSSLPSGEIPLGKMGCADDLAGTAEAPHIADAIRCGAEHFSLAPLTEMDARKVRGCKPGTVMPPRTSDRESLT